MRNLYKIAFVLLLMISFKGLAQDIIIKNDKTEIKSKVIELTADLIKYRKFTMLDGPIYSIDKSEVFMIVYKNGIKEYIESKANPTIVESSKTNNVTATKPKEKLKAEDNKIAAFNSKVNNPSSATKPTEKANAENSKIAAFNSTMPKRDTPTQAVSSDTASDDLYCIFGTDGSFSVYDINVNFPLKNHFYLGLGGFVGTNFYSIYGNLGYKMPLSKKISVYTNAGYGYTAVDTPSVSASGFAWNLGANYIFSNKWGVTVYSPNANGIMFGISIN
jgi:hypothetical protein